MRRLVPSVFTGLRARLILGFLLIASITLALVLVGVPRLLDAYFLQQAQDDLNRRTQDVGTIFMRVANRIDSAERLTEVVLMALRPLPLVHVRPDWIGPTTVQPPHEAVHSPAKTPLPGKL